MEFYDARGKPLEIGKPYHDRERKFYLNNSTSLCEITFLEKESFGLMYSDGSKKICDFPESLVSRAKTLVPIGKKDLETHLANIQTNQSWIEKHLFGKKE